MKLFPLIIATGLVLAAGAAGCSSSKEVETLPVEVRYAKAMAEFANADYLEAADDFKIVTVQYPGSSVADSAQFLIAQCRYRRGEYILAASECDLLVKTMPSSPLVIRARYMKAMSEYELSPKSSLDQKYTREAIDDFQSFIEYFPADSLSKNAASKINELNDKLARKDLDNANLYYRLEYYKAAIAYYDIVLDRHHDSQYADDALLGKARAMRQRRDDAGALEAINEFYAKYPTSDLKADVDALKAEIVAQPSKVPADKERRIGYSPTVTPP